MELLVRPQATLPFEWDPRAMPLPVRFARAGCVVSVREGLGGGEAEAKVEAEGNGKGEDGEGEVSAAGTDVFSVVAVARAAALVVDKCVKPARVSWGGRVAVGAKGAFVVVVGES